MDYLGKEHEGFVTVPDGFIMNQEEATKLMVPHCDPPGGRAISWEWEQE